MNEAYDLRVQSPLRFQRRGIVDVMETLEVLLRYIRSGNTFLEYFIDSNLLHVVLHALEAGINCAEGLLGRLVEYVGSAGRARFSRSRVWILSRSLGRTWCLTCELSCVKRTRAAIVVERKGWMVVVRGRSGHDG